MIARNQQLFIKMFKEIIKHAERDDCYECKQLMKKLDLKKVLENIQKRDS